MRTKDNYACFHCKIALKGNWGYIWKDDKPIANTKCSHCHRSMIFLGDKWRVPTKSDKQGWKKLVKSMSEHSNPLWHKAVADFL
jgi:hypothetical protein